MKSPDHLSRGGGSNNVRGVSTIIRPDEDGQGETEENPSELTHLDSDHGCRQILL